MQNTPEPTQPTPVVTWDAAAPVRGESPISPSKPSGARIHGQIVGTLAREVLGGALAPGDALPMTLIHL